MTSDDAPQTVLKAIRRHAYQYVHKPVEPAALEQRIQSLPAQALGGRAHDDRRRARAVTVAVDAEGPGAARIERRGVIREARREPAHVDVEIISLA